MKLKALEELITATPVDGVWLDFIRWPACWERAQPKLYRSSFDPITLRQFQEGSGVQWPSSCVRPEEVARWLLENAAEAWFAWRCQQITSFVAEARGILKRYRPSASLGCLQCPGQVATL